MFEGDCFEVDQETSREINRIWQPNHWELASKTTGDPRVLSLVGIIRFKLHQVQFNLENILEQAQTIQAAWTNGKNGSETSAFIIRCELESMLFTFSRIMNLLAGMIAIVYEIKTNFNEVRLKDFFPSLMSTKPFFNELQRKDLILAELLSSFYFSAENKLIMSFLNKNGFQNTAPARRYSLYSDKDAAQNEAGEYGFRTGELLFQAEMAIKLEKACRHVICKLGQLMFNHLNYEPIRINYFPGYQPVELSK
jgi:hypothetical protein